MTPAIPTDLVTPLGAYLRLRGPGRASFLLESVDQGRLGRYSLIGSGTRIVDIHEAERLNEPVVGHVGYDWITELEPTVPLPAPGRGLPVSQFIVADRLVRFDMPPRQSQGDPRMKPAAGLASEQANLKFLDLSLNCLILCRFLYLNFKKILQRN